MVGIEKNTVIAAIRNRNELEDAIESDSDIIFHLNPNILTLKDDIEKVHSKGKKLLIHLDLAEGIGKDKSGILYANELGIDGIISTRVNIIKAAKEVGLFTVQRFFIVDSHSVDTTVESLKSSKADTVEIMPGIISKTISDLCKKVPAPIIAGGLIETETEIKEALKNGATAVSTGKKELWKRG